MDTLFHSPSRWYSSTPYPRKTAVSESCDEYCYWWRHDMAMPVILYVSYGHLGHCRPDLNLPLRRFLCLTPSLFGRRVIVITWSVRLSVCHVKTITQLVYLINPPDLKGECGKSTGISFWFTKLSGYLWYGILMDGVACGSHWLTSSCSLGT